MRAVERLTDQTLLAKVAIEDKNRYVRRNAVERLTDPTLLAKVAIECPDWLNRQSVVWKITDQKILARIAVEDMSGIVRRAAVKRLTDQALLARIAVKDKAKNVREAAVLKLTDQVVLAKVALADDDKMVRKYAVEKLTDQKLQNTLRSHTGRANMINQLLDSDPLLMKISNSVQGVTSDARVCIARLKLAIQEPLIQARFPGIQCAVSIREITQRYKRVYTFDIRAGEDVSIRLHQAGKTLAEERWKTRFQNYVRETTSDRFVKADVNGGELLKKLLHLDAFTREDLIELLSSNIPEVKYGAGANITDQTLLDKVVIEDKNTYVRKTAKNRYAALRSDKNDSEFQDLLLPKIRSD